MCSFEISFVRSWYLRFSQNQLFTQQLTNWCNSHCYIINWCYTNICLHLVYQEDAAPPSVEPVVSSTDVPGVRKAAASATAKMKEELEKGKEGGSGTKVKLVLEDVDQVVSNEELLRLKEHFLQHGSVQCPQQVR